MGYRVQARVGVQAPASAVWAVLSSLETWSEWNPMFKEADGRLSIGSLISLRRAKPEGGSELEQVRVVDWVPNEQILWTRTLAPFARVLAFLEIEALSETGCILSIGEVYDGLIGERIGVSKRRPLNAQFQAMAEAAKARAEATWDGVPDDPVPPPPPPPPKKAKQPVASMGLKSGMRVK